MPHLSDAKKFPIELVTSCATRQARFTTTELVWTVWNVLPHLFPSFSTFHSDQVLPKSQMIHHVMFEVKTRNADSDLWSVSGEKAPPLVARDESVPC